MLVALSLDIRLADLLNGLEADTRCRFLLLFLRLLLFKTLMLVILFSTLQRFLLSLGSQRRLLREEARTVLSREERLDILRAVLGKPGSTLLHHLLHVDVGGELALAKHALHLVVPRGLHLELDLWMLLVVAQDGELRR